MYRLLLTTLLVVFLRLLTLAEAAAHPHFPSEPDRSDLAAKFDSPAAADAAPSARGSFEPDYFDFTAKALRPSAGASLLEEAGKTASPTGDPPSHAHPTPGVGDWLGTPLQADFQVALARREIVPPQLHHPPYYATAPPLPR